MDSQEVADRLYTVPPRHFVAERAAAIAAARQAGDRATAAALGKLRRPSVAAWLVNLLALRRPELVEQLAQLAGELRDAQRTLDGAALRELAGQRRQVVAGLVAQARALAAAEDPSVAGAKLPLAEVEATLHAALTDPAVAEQVRAGRLVRTAEPTGFGELPPPRLRLVTSEDLPRGDRGGAGDEPGDTELAGRQTEAEPAGFVTRQAAEERLAQARAEAESAAAELERCGVRQRALKQELADLDATIAELTTRRGDVTRQLVAAESAGLAARRAVAVARRQVGEAEATLSSAT